MRTKRNRYLLRLADEGNGVLAELAEPFDVHSEAVGGEREVRGLYASRQYRLLTLDCFYPHKKSGANPAFLWVGAAIKKSPH